MNIPKEFIDGCRKAGNGAVSAPAHTRRFVGIRNSARGYGLVAVPAMVWGIPNLEDAAGQVHWYLALTLIGLAGFHALAALKHHFIDRDRTLKKMLGFPSHQQQP